MPLGEAQTRLSVPKGSRALVLINWMALAIPFGARGTRSINKVSIRVARALTLGAERDRNQPMIYIAICSSLCNMNAVVSLPKLCHIHELDLAEAAYSNESCKIQRNLHSEDL